MKPRLIIAMLCYALLALMAGLTLEHELIRAAVWVVLGGLAAKTWIAFLKSRQE